MTANLYNCLGNTHFRQGKVDEAVSAYKLAVQAADAGEHLTAAYSNLGTCYWKSGNVSEAVHMLEQALAVHELDLVQRDQDMKASLQAAAIYHQLGVCYCLMSEYTDALSRLEQARAIRVRADASSVGPTLDAMGKVYLMQNRLDEAMTCHQQALQIQYNAQTLRNMANVHLQSGNTTAAITVLQEVCKLQKSAGLETPSQRDLHRQTCKLLVKLYDETGNVEQAEELRAECR